jgi:hypothetical protein
VDDVVVGFTSTEDSSGEEAAIAEIVGSAVCSSLIVDCVTVGSLLTACTVAADSKLLVNFVIVGFTLTVDVMNVETADADSAVFFYFHIACVQSGC